MTDRTKGSIAALIVSGVLWVALIWFVAAIVPAYAQSVPLQGGPWTPGNVPMYSASGGSQPILQDSGVPAVLFAPSFADNLTATGNTQLTAIPLGASTNAFVTVPSGTGTILPLSGAVAGSAFEIINAGTNSLSVYPPSGQSINANSVNAAVTIYPHDVASFIYRGPQAWYAQ